MPRFLKQYGERRTGTNALRALVSANCPDAVVLMHILGDKHSPPVPLDEVWRQARAASEPAWAFVSGATQRAPSATTRTGDAAQAAEMRRHAEALAAAYADGGLGFLVSIKDPYAWAVSLARFLRWPAGRCEAQLRAECARFCERYRAWAALHEPPRTTVVVRHEDLVREPRAVLERIGAGFGLAGVAAFRPVEGVAEPTPWDHLSTRIRPQPFDAGPYHRHEYLAALPPAYRQAVTETMDWELMGRFGYAPLPD